MIKAILAVIVLTGLVTTDSENYYILNTIADVAFYFMPSSCLIMKVSLIGYHLTCKRTPAS